MAMSRRLGEIPPILFPLIEFGSMGSVHVIALCHHMIVNGGSLRYRVQMVHSSEVGVLLVVMLIVLNQVVSLEQA